MAGSGCVGGTSAELGCDPAETACQSLEIEPPAPTPAVDAEGNALEGMVLIPGGSFEMGIAEADLAALVEMGQKVPHMSELLAKWWFGDEIPRHTVEVTAFHMDTHEVTNREFSRFVEETGYEAQGNWRQYATEGRSDHPVIQVSWHDAQAYAEWTGKRLPSEAEWEYAARGGQDVKWFPWGDSVDTTCANYGWRADETFLTGIPRLLGLVTIRTRPVGCYPPNGYGLYDMCGNVCEWCENERTPYPGGPEEDWIYTQYGPFREGEEPFYGKATRGGSWDDPNAVFVRITDRNGRAPEDSSYGMGFRCVRSIDE
ncbi:MAG: SUMF1/EgtB/PvdO family nonheme iron enzyme [Phycisphaerae bacterium]|nr:SUMF1/EgtB/PvdO family nonheme iron enzyme [Phycisphaerae bacterium]